jgi:hypothetical protein
MNCVLEIPICDHEAEPIHGPGALGADQINVRHNMEKRRLAFPRSLDAVVWLNLLAGLVALANGLLDLFTANLTNGAVQIGSSAVSFLIVVGILKRSKLVRLIVLIFAWVGIIYYGLLFLAASLTNGAAAILAAIALAVNAVTIWGLTNSSSRQYFEAA